MERFFRVGNNQSQVPSRAYRNDVGYDLYAVGNHIVRPGSVTPIHVGWGVCLRDHEVGLVCPRSGLALNGFTVVNAPGIIDPGYTGELIVIATSLAEHIEVMDGMAVAQLVIVNNADVHASGNERSEKGFGSSG